MKEPNKYLGQSVKIKDIYVVGFEDAWLESGSTCLVLDENRRKINFKFDKLWEQLTEKKVSKKMNKLLKKRGIPPYYLKKINVVLNGEFLEYEKQNQYDNRYEFQFLVKKVESVSKIKN